MVTLCVQNLCLVIGEDCNLNCLHCLRGEKTKKVMSDQVIEETFNQIKLVHNLNICGGEPTLLIERLQKVIEVIVQKRIIVENISVTINGTIYSKKLINLAKYFVRHSNHRGLKRNNFKIYISLDKYHYFEVQRLGLYKQYCTNLDKYEKSRFFGGYRALDYNLYNEGNARYLNEPKEEFIPHLPIITYAGFKGVEDKENGVCNIGPLVTISTEGIVTEDNVPFENQETIYNYGSIFKDRIDNILIRNGAKVVLPQEFDEENSKILTKILENKK